MSFCKSVFIIVGVALIAGCTSPPQNTDNICEIFFEKDDWYEDAADARDNWNSSIPVMMAIMHQESRFKHKARPPRKMIFGFIPGPRPSDAYGYSQAKEDTWDWYTKDSGNYGADRDDFSDAIDFIGWYNHVSAKQSSIKSNDTYHLYLAYHEGHGGFNRRTFNRKPWLKTVAKKVSGRSSRYASQLNQCEEQLQSPWWKLW
ncbi:MAG: transglycosylase SLT domain-containing protein [Oceanicoccus sp.]